MNTPLTVALCVIIAGICIAVIAKLIIDKKKGKPSCSSCGSCSSCPMKCSEKKHR